MNRRAIRILLLWVTLALPCAGSGLGCGNAIDVHAKTSPTADFSRYQTFGFGPPETAPARYSEVERAKQAELHAQAFVSEALQNKGYRPTTTPDLLVRVAAGVRRRAAPIPLAPPPPGGPPSDKWFTEDEVGELLEGALVVDVYDAPTGALLWHGAARALIDPDHFDEERLRRGVAAVMSSFPERR